VGQRLRNSLPKAGAWFVTTTTWDWRPVFKSREAAETALLLLGDYCRRHGVGLLDYVIMPSHIHLIVRTSESGGGLSEFMRDFKKGLAHELQASWGDGAGLWQDRFDDLYLTDEDTLRIKAEYIRFNPVRAGLAARPEDFIYSSAYARRHPEKVVCPVEEYEV